MQTTPKPLDFAKVEVLRRHMVLTSAQMAKLIGVSRVTYYNWVHGKPVRTKNEAAVKSTVRKLIALANEQKWPTKEALALPAGRKFERLLALIEHTS